MGKTSSKTNHARHRARTASKQWSRQKRRSMERAWRCENDAQMTSEGYQNPTKTDLEDPPEHSQGPNQAKNTSKSESFWNLQPCEAEKGGQNASRMHPKSLQNSDRFCTSFSAAFRIPFWHQKALQKGSIHNGKSFAIKVLLSAEWSSKTSSCECIQAHQGTTSKSVFFVTIYSSFEDLVLGNKRRIHISRTDQRTIIFMPKTY